MLGRLSSAVYPEYARVFGLMMQRQTHDLYTRESATCVTAIDDNRVHLRRLDDRDVETIVETRAICICVGLKTELPMMDQKHEFDADYRSIADHSLFAVGSVAGDHFVRYLIGGAFRVAQHLFADVFEAARQCAANRRALLERHGQLSSGCSNNDERPICTDERMDAEDQDEAAKETLHEAGENSIAHLPQS